MKYIPNIAAIVLAAFAVLTLFLTLSIFFDLFGVREMEGNYVLFVVIANFICSLCYFVAAYGFWKQKKWTTQILILAVGVLFIALVSFMIYTNNGGLHEPKTTGALIFRLAFTGLFAIASYKYHHRFLKSN